MSRGRASAKGGTLYPGGWVSVLGVSEPCWVFRLLLVSTFTDFFCSLAHGHIPAQPVMRLTFETVTGLLLLLSNVQNASKNAG